MKSLCWQIALPRRLGKEVEYAGTSACCDARLLPSRSREYGCKADLLQRNLLVVMQPSQHEPAHTVIQRSIQHNNL